MTDTSIAALIEIERPDPLTAVLRPTPFKASS
jgi:hypothetical protein